MEKKIEVQKDGRTFLVQEHMLSDLAKLGVTTTKRSIKEPPKELINMPKKVIMPSDVLPEMVNIPEVKPEVIHAEVEKKVRKAPVRSKAKK